MNPIKILICILLVSSGNLIYSQNYPYLSTEEKKECTIKGTIDNKYPITLHLKFKCFSGYIVGVYSVTGSYSYDKHKIEIPLQGVYRNQLSLYHFNLKERDSLLLSQALIDCYFPDTLTKQLSCKECFLLGKNGKGEGVWKSGDKEFSASLDIEDNNIFEEQTYLHFSNGKYCNLTDHFWSATTYQYICSNADESIVVLKFRRPENANVLGRCGAEHAEGVYVLRFNEAKELLSHREYLLQSCFENLSYITLSANESSQVKFGVAHWDWEIDKKWTIGVDKNSCEVKVDSSVVFEYPDRF
jgi:hypothetical protein